MSDSYTLKMIFNNGLRRSMGTYEGSQPSDSELEADINNYRKHTSVEFLSTIRGFELVRRSDTYVTALNF